ncbi:uncharacterized protein EV422DRAFT_542788 [Fimicolochytrium jonesii]|uniref:uncharacterized protein n=1 Tax=Fimicolochytrium jonesii TaxID=1396493 RepID=UPI0022FE9AF6|nr:uncharacterized protein EV422DRAFT_542788 [Fimicolochytrium jonesii]KAI8817189.1 hypothetical protein EV422DRAFT_542788 [Fimicolochytrium jonesii]
MEWEGRARRSESVDFGQRGSITSTAHTYIVRMQQYHSVPPRSKLGGEASECSAYDSAYGTSRFVRHRIHHFTGKHISVGVIHVIFLWLLGGSGSDSSRRLGCMLDTIGLSNGHFENTRTCLICSAPAVLMAESNVVCDSRYVECLDEAALAFESDGHDNFCFSFNASGHLLRT